LAGGAGNDTCLVRNATDVIDETAGNGTNDHVIASVGFVLAADDAIEVPMLDSPSGTAALNQPGNALVQTITGNAGVNVLSDGGGTGQDTLMGLAGNDICIRRNAGITIIAIAGNASDRVAASGSFVLTADDHIEILTTTSSGGTTAINLTGNALAQSINGNAGVNVIDGAAGSDTLTSGIGADTFRLSSAPGATNVDRLTNFVSGSDRIDLSSAIFTAFSGNPEADEFVFGSAALDANA